MRADSSTISLTDEAALSWYFGQGLSIYQRSTFGAIIAKLNRDGFGSEPCPRCTGGGILEKGGVNVENICKTCNGERRKAKKTGQGDDWCETCHGLGTVDPYDVEVELGGWCPACSGTGYMPVGSVLRRTPCSVCGTFNRHDRRPYASKQAASCSHCVGTGFEPITARPLQASEAYGVIADDSALTRFAITSRRVEKVRAQSPALSEALAAYYGDIGQRWAASKRGRLFSLYHLTGPGRKLARWGEKAGKGADLDLTAQERIWTQVALEAGQPRQERKALLDAAHDAAFKLYARAARAWNKEAGSKRERDVWKRLMTSLSQTGHNDLAEAIGIEKLGTEITFTGGGVVCDEQGI